MAEQRHPPEHIQAKSVYLRRHRVSDAAAIASAVTESLAELQPWMPWADGTSGDPDAQRRRLELVVPNWERGTEYVYLLFGPDQDRVLGCVALMRRVGPTALEIGYWLRTSETGGGIMTEAVRALSNEALALKGVDQVEIRCDQANEKSAAVARRLGFRLASIVDVDANAPGGGRHQMVWVLDQPGPGPAV